MAWAFFWCESAAPLHFLTVRDERNHQDDACWLLRLLARFISAHRLLSRLYHAPAAASASNAAVVSTVLRLVILVILLLVPKLSLLQPLAIHQRPPSRAFSRATPVWGRTRRTPTLRVNNTHSRSVVLAPGAFARRGRHTPRFISAVWLEPPWRRACQNCTGWPRHFWAWPKSENLSAWIFWDTGEFENGAQSYIFITLKRLREYGKWHP